MNQPLTWNLPPAQREPSLPCRARLGRDEGRSDTSVPTPTPAGKVHTRPTASRQRCREDKRGEAAPGAHVPMRLPSPCGGAVRAVRTWTGPQAHAEAAPTDRTSRGHRDTAGVTAPGPLRVAELWGLGRLVTGLQVPLSAGLTQGSGLRANPQHRATSEPCCVSLRRGPSSYQAG